MVAIRLRRFLDDESGQSAVEYALILALASFGVALALLVLQDSLKSSFDRTGHKLEAGTSPGASPPPPGGAARQ